jgi:hypothetical protein
MMSRLKTERETIDPTPAWRAQQMVGGFVANGGTATYTGGRFEWMEISRHTF